MYIVVRYNSKIKKTGGVTYKMLTHGSSVVQRVTFVPMPFFIAVTGDAGGSW